MKKLLFLFNPRSGKGLIKNKLMEILDIFVKAQYELSVFVTQKAGDANEYVSQHGSQVDLVVCCGGDGTLNETVSGLMLLQQRPALGYIPAGSTNDFASSLRIPKNMLAAARMAVSGVERELDVGNFCGLSYFVYVAAFGAFTEVSYATPQDAKNLLGHQAYMLEAVKRISQLKSYPMKVEWEGGQLEEEFILGMVTNTISIGGFKGLVNMEVALDDGQFEILLVKTPKKPRDLQQIASYLLLKEGENDCVFTFRSSWIRMICQDSVDWTLDGEYGGSHTTAEIQNLSGCLRMRTEPEPDKKIINTL